MKRAEKMPGNTKSKSGTEPALRLKIRLRRQGEVAKAFGKYPWHGDLARSRRGR